MFFCNESKAVVQERTIRQSIPSQGIHAINFASVTCLSTYKLTQHIGPPCILIITGVRLSSQCTNRSIYGTMDLI